MKKQWIACCMSCAVCLGAIPAAGAYDVGWIGQHSTISAGSSTTSVIQNGGSLWVTGENILGQPGDEMMFYPVKMSDKVSAVSQQAILQDDGSLWAWGDFFSSSMQAAPSKILDDAAAVADHMVVAEDGTLWTWEYDLQNNDFQLHQKKRLENVSVISRGGGHYAAVQKDGTLWTWGSNTRHELGPGVQGYQHDPVRVMDGVATVACGSGYTAVIRTDGTLWMWGDNVYGQLGNGKPQNSVSTPVKVLDDVVAVSCGGGHTAAIQSDGTLWMWGYNVAGQVGNDGEWTDRTTTGDRLQSSPVKVMDDVAAVSCGWDHTIALKIDGTLWGWGNNSDGQLGNGGKGNDANLDGHMIQTIPVQILDSVALPATVGAGFYDVFTQDYYAQAVQWAVEREITAGTSSVAFSPKATCTTAQILTFLWRANGSPSPSLGNPFEDVSTSDYYYQAARWAAEKGLVSGTKFQGDAPCTRANTVTYLWKLAGSPDTEAAAFTDVPADAAYAQAVAWAVEQGITAGTSATTFSPDSICTRGQIVTFLYRGLA